MTLIAAGVVLKQNLDPKSEGHDYYKEYKRGETDLLNRFPNGQIQLKRIGYPQINQAPPDSGMESLPEVPPPIYIKAMRSIDGVMWEYTEGTVIKDAQTGLATINPGNATIDLSGEILTIDVKKKPDYAFFIMMKSGIVGSHFEIYDPEGDQIRASEEKTRKLKVQFAIRESLAEEKLRTVASAYGIVNANKKHIAILQDELENLVFANEERKKHDAMNFALKGVTEFLAEIKNDDLLRPRAIVQFGIDEGRFKYLPQRYKWQFDEGDICDVAPGREEQRNDDLLRFLTQEKNKSIWVSIIKELVTSEYVEKMDKYGVRYLAEQVDVPLNQKEEKLRTALLEALAAK